MSESKRREFLKVTAGVAAGAALGGGSALFPIDAGAAEYKITPEKGAKLRLLRWKRFVQGDETLWMENTKKFTERTGIPVQVDNESWEDVRPKAAVAANIGSGPDLILGWLDDPFQYTDKLVDVTDLADYLGAKYGGWYDICRTYGMHGNRWMSIPVGIVGNAIVYRDSLIKAAGFDGVPKDSAGFLKLCKALKSKGTPAGFAFGHAVGDGNTWCNWLLWQQGGRLADAHNNVVINSPQTLAALEYAKELYPTFIPGTLSWGDPSNNKAFLGGQISLTANGISIYYVALDSPDPAMKAMAADIQHARFPIG
ncbi:MAG: ABC transporter substrate-binding protein, partial [Pseudomonadota bacterium]